MGPPAQLEARIARVKQALLRLGASHRSAQRRRARGPGDARPGGRVQPGAGAPGRQGLGARIRTESRDPVQFKTRSQAVAVYSVAPGQRP